MSSKILIFCGKGGVGKTTLSLAFGLRRASAGERVLIVTSHPLPELAIAVSLDGLSAQYPAAGKNLFVVHLNPHELLLEVVHRHFPVAAAADAIIRSSLFKNLIEVAPGLKEFYFLSRMQQLAERNTPQSAIPAYDLLVWDAPATGHFLTTLHSAQTFDQYLTGPLASAGAEVARFFSNISNISLLPVATLEEMAIAETMDMTQVLERDFQLKCWRLLLNLVSPMVIASELAVAQLEEPTDPVSRFAFKRGRVERERAEFLRKALAAPSLAIPRLGHGATDLDLLGRVAAFLEIPVD
jgi:anion-transporting  ArsA/GET3 family ATPase